MLEASPSPTWCHCSGTIDLKQLLLTSIDFELDGLCDLATHGVFYLISVLGGAVLLQLYWRLLHRTLGVIVAVALETPESLS